MSTLKLNEQDWLVYTNERGRDRNSSNADVLQAGEHAVEMVAALGCQMVVYGGRLGHECLILRRLGIEHAEGVTLVESAQSSKKKIKEKTIFFLPLHAVCRELAPHRPQVVDEHVSVRLPARAISERVDLELVQQAITHSKKRLVQYLDNATKPDRVQEVRRHGYHLNVGYPPSRSYQLDPKLVKLRRNVLSVHPNNR